MRRCSSSPGDREEGDGEEKGDESKEDEGEGYTKAAVDLETKAAARGTMTTVQTSYWATCPPQPNSSHRKDNENQEGT